jgi:diphthamide biosynthesis methyltransferase
MSSAVSSLLPLDLIGIFTSRGKKVYEPARFMTVNTAISQLLEVEEMHMGSGTI